MATASPPEAAGLVLDLLGSRPPTLGGGRLVCVDGPGGSGKTTLAGQVGAATGATVVHLDDLYDGWSGLAGIPQALEGLLRPLAGGRPGTYRRYDWHAGAYAETVTVEPAPVLVLEGVGAGCRAVAHLVTVLAWVWVPGELRLARGLERDGAHLAPQWHAWMADEERHFAAEGTAERADVMVDGTGVSPAVRVR